MAEELKTLKMQKAALRKIIKSEVAAFCSDLNKKRNAEEKAAILFLESDIYKNSSFIFCFISSLEEISTFKIIEQSIKDGKKIVVPRVRKNCLENKMDFYYLKNLPLSEQTQSGSFGIIEPLECLKMLEFSEVPENALMIMPGLGFSKSGERLGKGKGFYDLFIKELCKFSKNFRDSSKKCGFCFEIQLKEKIPVDEYDQKVDYVVFENGIIDCHLV